MTLRPFVFAIVTAVAGAHLAPIAASAAPWTIDPAHTSVDFSVNHLGFSNVQGTFREFSADVDFDPENFAASKVSFVIQADSVDTGWAARDEHLRGSDFLDIENHGEITFQSTSVVETGPTTATVTGDLTIRGKTEPATFDATLNKLGPNPFAPDTQVAGMTLTGEVDRTLYGIDFGAPAIGAVLPVTINLEMSPAS